MLLEAVVIASALDYMCKLKAVLKLLAVVCPRDTDICVKSQYGGCPHVVSYNRCVLHVHMGVCEAAFVIVLLTV